MIDDPTTTTSSNEPVAIVLSGGGTLLYTHIGVLQALEDAGLLNDRARGFAQHNQVRAVVGTSAGSVVGSFLACGYPPHEIWKLVNWRVWGAEPPRDAHQTTNVPKPQLLELLDIDWAGLEVGLLRNIVRFKGLVRGDQALRKLRQLLYLDDDAKQDPRFGVRASPNYDTYVADGTVLPPKQRKELYVVAANLNDGRETVFHFRQQLKEPVTKGIEPGRGREVNYAIYEDSLEPAPGAERMTIAEAVRCSIAIPGTFRPYFKRLTVLRQRDGARIAETLSAYFTDGGVRDGFPLSIAAKVPRVGTRLGYRNILGVMLDSPEYRYESAGRMNLAQLISRVVGRLMVQTIYEADQDDGDISSRSIRAVIPVFGRSTRQRALLDPSIAAAARRTGYVAGAYLVYGVRRGLHPTQDWSKAAKQRFVEDLLQHGAREEPLVTWDDVFRPQPEFEPARGRAGEPASDPASYYVVRPTGADGEEFDGVVREVLSRLCDDKDPEPVAAVAMIEGASLTDLDYPQLDIALGATQSAIVGRLRIIVRVLLAAIALAPVALLTLVENAAGRGWSAAVWLVLCALLACFGALRKQRSLVLAALVLGGLVLMWAIVIWVLPSWLVPLLPAPWSAWLPVLFAVVVTIVASGLVMRFGSTLGWAQLQRFVEGRVSQ